MSRSRVVWAVDWPILLVIWPAYVLKGLVAVTVLSIKWTVLGTVWFYRWVFKPAAPFTEESRDGRQA